MKLFQPVKLLKTLSWKLKCYACWLGYSAKLSAIQLDTKQVGALIAQIPEKHTCLAKALQQKVNDFDYGQIINLTQYIPCLWVAISLMLPNTQS